MMKLQVLTKSPEIKYFMKTHKTNQKEFFQDDKISMHRRRVAK